MQFSHIGRGCLGAQPCHIVGAVYHGVGDSWGCSFPSPTGEGAWRAGDGVVGWGGNRFAIPTLLGDFGLGEGKPHYGLWGLRFMDFWLLFCFYLFIFAYFPS